ncbi:MAG: hypothetical protein LUD81_04735 [Clostridiales bacterium]|nr:hypothetical protein [Clostridiales bacterium]
MSKITAYTAATRFDSGDKLLKDGTNGTKIITVANAAVEFAGLVSGVNHRNVYRGKSLGGAITDDQKTAISSGTFDDLFIGDYWTIADSNGTSRNYRIADMDYWYNTGDTAFTSHHLVIVPDTLGISASMNSSNTTAGGYVGSEMYTTTLPTVTETVSGAFGDMLLTHREYLVNAVTNGYASGTAWYDSTAELMNEIMVYGCSVMSPMGNGSTVVNNRTAEKSQLALFALNPRMINYGTSFWLRDVVSATSFAFLRYYGNVDYTYASASYDVRPVFAVG